jgi:uncharacterized protein (DUF362 family)
MNQSSEKRVGIGSVDYNKYSPSDIYSFLETGNTIQKAFISFGLGIKNPDFPLMDIVNPGETVLIKPNWVNHKNFNLNDGVDCLYTHPKFIEHILGQLEGCHPGKVIIGDAPIQGCIFDKIASPDWRQMIQEKFSFPIEIIDFRQTILENNTNDEHAIWSRENINRKNEDFLLFDLGSSSSLEEISSRDNIFRVAQYNHHELNKAHKKGMHQYLIARELFNVDVILNLPKLKTHKKAGMTGALKNLVGINGSKNFLPHHRVGGSGMGGDNYSGLSILKRTSEYLIDQANMRIGRKHYKQYKKVSGYFSSLANRIETKTDFEGGWYGNDTTWRMVMDLNKIILYGNITGRLSLQPLRRVYSITDAIIAGDTEGPLSVEPVNLGIVTFSTSSAFADLVHASLMHFDWQKIPCIREAFNLKNYPIVQHMPEDCQVILNGIEISFDELTQKYGKPFRPAKYWKGHIEIQN